MERLKHMKEMLMASVEGQMGHLEQVDAHELGEAIDMIKDIEEAMYYCSITKAMKETEEEKKYLEKYIPYYSSHRDMDRGSGHMYYDERYSKTRRKEPYIYNPNDYQDISIERDSREGRSPEARRGYMESKELHKDKNIQMKELEKYVQELTNDVIDMIADATPEEKTMLQQKITLLASKIK